MGKYIDAAFKIVVFCFICSLVFSLFIPLPPSMSAGVDVNNLTDGEIVFVVIASDSSIGKACVCEPESSTYISYYKGGDSKLWQAKEFRFLAYQGSDLLYEKIMIGSDVPESIVIGESFVE